MLIFERLQVWSKTSFNKTCILSSAFMYVVFIVEYANLKYFVIVIFGTNIEFVYLKMYYRPTTLIVRKPLLSDYIEFLYSK